MLGARCARAAAATAILLATGSAAAAAPDLVASVGCRDGAPNGAYDLRMADGRMRILGAFAIVGLESYLAGFGQWVTVITGSIFVVCVLAFRRGIVGELGAWWAKRGR